MLRKCVTFYGFKICTTTLKKPNLIATFHNSQITRSFSFETRIETYPTIYFWCQGAVVVSASVVDNTTRFEKRQLRHTLNIFDRRTHFLNDEESFFNGDIVRVMCLPGLLNFHIKSTSRQPTLLPSLQRLNFDVILTSLFT